MNQPQTNKETQIPWWKTPRAKKVGFASLALALGLILIWWFFFHPYVRTDDARVSMTFIRLAPEGVGGRIEKVSAAEGDTVKRGDILVELDHRIPEAQLLRAKSRSKLTQHELARAEQLAKQNGIPARDLDKAQAEAQSAEAELKLAQTNFDNTFIKSPIDGVVVQKLAEVGNILEPGQVALTIADVNGAWVSANIEENYVGPVKPGQQVDIDIDEGGTLSGKVFEVRKAAASQFALIPSENAAGNFTKLVQRIPVKIVLDPHPETTLRAGQSVVIKIHTR